MWPCLQRIPTRRCYFSLSKGEARLHAVSSFSAVPLDASRSPKLLTETPEYISTNAPFELETVETKTSSEEVTLPLSPLPPPSPSPPKALPSHFFFRPGSANSVLTQRIQLDKHALTIAGDPAAEFSDFPAEPHQEICYELERLDLFQLAALAERLRESSLQSGSAGRGGGADVTAVSSETGGVSRTSHAKAIAGSKRDLAKSGGMGRGGRRQFDAECWTAVGGRALSLLERNEGHLSSSAVARLLMVFADVKYKDEKLYAMCAERVPLMAPMGSWAFVHLVVAWKRLRLAWPYPQTVLALIERFRKRIDNVSFRWIAAFLTATVGMRNQLTFSGPHETSQILDQFVSDLGYKLAALLVEGRERVSARDVAVAVNAMTGTERGRQHRAFVSALEEHLPHLPLEFDSSSIALCASSLARIPSFRRMEGTARLDDGSCVSEQSLLSLSKMAKKWQGRLGARHLVMVADAFSRVEWRDRKLMDLVSRWIHQRHLLSFLDDSFLGALAGAFARKPSAIEPDLVAPFAAFAVKSRPLHVFPPETIASFLELHAAALPLETVLLVEMWDALQASSTPLSLRELGKAVASLSVLPADLRGTGSEHEGYSSLVDQIHCQYAQKRKQFVKAMEIETIQALKLAPSSADISTERLPMLLSTLFIAAAQALPRSDMSLSFERQSLTLTSPLVHPAAAETARAWLTGTGEEEGVRGRIQEAFSRDVESTSGLATACFHLLRAPETQRAPRRSEALAGLAREAALLLTRPVEPQTYPMCRDGTGSENAREEQGSARRLTRSGVVLEALGRRGFVLERELAALVGQVNEDATNCLEFAGDKVGRAETTETPQMLPSLRGLTRLFEGLSLSGEPCGKALSLLGYSVERLSCTEEEGEEKEVLATAFGPLASLLHLTLRTHKHTHSVSEADGGIAQDSHECSEKEVGGGSKPQRRGRRVGRTRGGHGISGPKSVWAEMMEKEAPGSAVRQMPFIEVLRLLHALLALRLRGLMAFEDSGGVEDVHGNGNELLRGFADPSLESSIALLLGELSRRGKGSNLDLSDESALCLLSQCLNAGTCLSPEIFAFFRPALVRLVALLRRNVTKREEERKERVQRAAQCVGEFGQSPMVLKSREERLSFSLSGANRINKEAPRVESTPLAAWVRAKSPFYVSEWGAKRKTYGTDRGGVGDAERWGLREMELSETREALQRVFGSGVAEVVVGGRRLLRLRQWVAREAGLPEGVSAFLFVLTPWDFQRHVAVSVSGGRDDEARGEEVSGLAVGVDGEEGEMICAGRQSNSPRGGHRLHPFVSLELYVVDRFLHDGTGRRQKGDPKGSGGGLKGDSSGVFEEHHREDRNGSENRNCERVETDKDGAHWGMEMEQAREERRGRRRQSGSTWRRKSGEKRAEAVSVERKKSVLSDAMEADAEASVVVAVDGGWVMQRLREGSASPGSEMEIGCLADIREEVLQSLKRRFLTFNR
uniref:Uncharacterized protein n=1 Tax=Chromera velia CCMP2878 TaxID=1169474 RepID=A0A0G4GTT0_9ALVE|eukprot:Cvel_23367.t1-p1 / transcript=Cvel_23367.t1 / gene=Cvel_23367 / organism=Chromera_velia_CCMP2878 / gene_product=hypothetical protein / transcript_product=hypothetical protein / location=Cvel_scaffold2399:16744-24073(+) / protein_length=1464 / sequence_SO=supercontig / SO=protein_coding / is_pseudo=false